MKNLCVNKTVHKQDINAASDRVEKRVLSVCQSGYVEFDTRCSTLSATAERLQDQDNELEDVIETMVQTHNQTFSSAELCRS